MTARAAAILSALAVLALALALLLGAPQHGDTAVSPGTPACPGLTAAAAAQIEITHAGRTLTLARDDTGWTVPAEDGRATLPGRAEGLLAAMSATVLEEPRTDDPARYARLGVEDAATPSATNTMVRVLGEDGTARAALVLGHAEGGDRMFVRRPGEQRAWLARSSVAASVEPSDWLDMRLFDVPADDVARIAIDRADGDHLLLARTDDTLTVQDPANPPRLDPYKVGDVGRAVRAIDWTQARRADLPGTLLGHAAVTTRGGQVVTLTVDLDGPDGWVATDDPADAGWAFRVPASRAQAIVPALSDLLAYKPPPAPPAPGKARR